MKLEQQLREKIRSQGKADSTDGATAAKSPLESLLANPQLAIDRRRDDDQDPPRLRVWAG